MMKFEDDFWAKTKKEKECIVWCGLTSNGYGQVYKDKKTKWAHRVAWEITNGLIPNGLWVLHKCDNKPCVNPDHLFLGTRSDNMKDSAQKGRLAMFRKQKKFCPNGHEYTKDNTYHHPRTKSRHCRACRNLSNKRYRRRLKNEQISGMV